MKKHTFLTCLALGLLLLLGAHALASPSSDRVTDIIADGLIDQAYGPPAATDSNADGNNNDNMDLVELYIAEDATNYYFAFTIDADVGATDWGKYIIYVDTTNDANGATLDAWGRNVVVDDPHKPEFGLYTWVDSPPYGGDHTQFWVWDGASWSQSGTLDNAALATGEVSVLEWQVAKSRLGNPSQIWVEVWSTGALGTPNAQDTINDPPEDWNAWDWDTSAVLACSTRYPGVKLSVSYPPEGHYFALPYIDVTGSVSPTTGVTLTVDLNGTSWYTPTLSPDGSFTQTVILVQGSNTLTVTAESAQDATTVVRHVFFGAAHDDDVYWDGLYHDSRDLAYRTPIGAVPTGIPMTLRFRSYTGDLTDVRLRIWDDRADTATIYPMTIVYSDPAYDYWEGSLPAQNLPTVLWYRFIVIDGSDTDYYEDDHVVSDVYRGYNEGGPGKAYDNSPDYSFQISVYDPNYTTPDWIKDAVVYQIFPDRFRDGDPANNVISGTHFMYGDPDGGIEYPAWNSQVIDPRDPSSPFHWRWSEDFYGGDLPGITEKLDYLQSVGVTALYLNPIFYSPSNHKYDTTNFKTVDPHLGTNAELAQLLAQAQARGMHVVLDGVFNHTSSDSLYFDKYSRWDANGDETPVGQNDGSGAYESQSSPYYDWYTFYEWPEDYESWWGYDTLPVLNSENPAVRDYFYSGTDPIGPRWVISGTSGWRLDVGGDIDPGLTRDPANDYWEGFRQAVKGADPDAVIFGEEWGDATPWLLGAEWDAVMNYRFRSALLSFMRERHYDDNDNNSGSSGGVLDPITPSQLDAWLHSIQEDYPPEAWQAMMNLMGSHDTNRMRFVLSKNQKGEDTQHIPYNPATDFSPEEVDVYQKLLALLQFTLPGAPTIYYGDEAGIDAPGRWYNDKWEDDPYNRVPFPWDDASGDYYSFRQTIHDHYSLLGQTRADHPALRTGSFDTLLTDDEDMLYVYGRKSVSPADAAVVAINRHLTEPQTIVVDLNGYLGTGTVLTDALNGGQPYTVSVSGLITLTDVPPMWGALLVYASGDLQPPNPPTNLSAVEGDGQVALSWDSVTGAASYNLYRSLLSGGNYTLIAPDLTSTSYTDGSVVNGTWYYYVVSAVDGAGNESDYSNEAAALPHYEIDWANLQWPPEITHTIGLTPTPAIYGQVWISGVTSLPGQTDGLSAQVGYGPIGTPPLSWIWWVEASFNTDVGNNDEFMTDLLPEYIGEYDYLYRYSSTGGRDWVYADQSGLISPTAVVSPGLLHVLSSGDVTPPPAPADLQVARWGVDYIALTWEPVTAPDLYAYDLYRWSQGETISNAVQIARALAPTSAYTDTDVLTGQTYTYTVQALDTSFNRSAFSNYASARPQERWVTLTFQLQVPAFTPSADVVYVAGDNADVFGAQWNPGHLSLNPVDPTHWVIVLAAPEDLRLEYKYTRGNWDTVERWSWLVGYANRIITPTYGATGAMTVTDVVYNWRDPLVTSHYPDDGAAGVDPAVVISATLSRDMDPATLTPDNLVVSGASTPTLHISFYDYPHSPHVTATTILLTPTSALIAGARYSVTLMEGLQGSDNEGVRLQHAYVWSFRTMGPELSIAKLVEPMLDVPLGGVLTYTIILSNSGDGPANGTVMTDRLPLGVSFGGWLDQGSALLPDPPGDTITWGPHSLPAGESFTIRFTATLATDPQYYGQTITNTAYYSQASAQGSAAAVFVVESEPLPEPILSITKTVETAHTPAQLGDPVTYTLVVANGGLGDAAGVVVSDVLPLGVVGSDLSRTVTITAGDQVTFIIAAAVTTDTLYYGQTITNTAYYSHASGRGSSSASFAIQAGPVSYQVYLPVVLRSTP